MITRTTPADTERENQVAETVARQYGWDFQRTGYYDNYDLMFMREGRLVGIGEIKNRNHEHNRYDSVFLSAHKWLTLVTASQGLGVPGLFIVSFTDQIRTKYVSDIDASAHQIAGRSDRPDAPNDQELIIHVPVGSMEYVYDGSGPSANEFERGW